MSESKLARGKQSSKKLSIPSKLSDAQIAILSLKRTMDEEASTILKERAHFEVMRKKLDNVHFKKHVKLNVGGQAFKTSIETLVKDPDSMLSSMFSQRFDVKPDEDGEYFIDRDGTHFRFILNYLRTGKLIYPKDNKVLEKELFLEAEFYQINGIQKQMWPGATFENSSYIINNLTDVQRNALLSWLPQYDIHWNWVQIYSSSNQGWCPTTFHQQCDNKGPTVVIARSGNYIFGGYAGVSWSAGSSEVLVKDDNAFLFTLANSTGASPTKLEHSRRNGAGIWYNSAYGPTFGSATGGATLIIMNNNNSANYCYITDSNFGFDIPDSQTFSTFINGGNTTFKMNYLEVFALKET